MNLTEHSKYLKSKFATVMADWDKLTINQLEQIEQLLNKLLPTVEKKEPKSKSKSIAFRRTNGMNEAMHKEITELRSLGWSWEKLSKKFGYACGTSIRTSYVLWGEKHNNPVTPAPTVTSVHFSNS